VDAGITRGGRWTSQPAAGAEALPGRFVLPGLVDAHCHLSVGQTGDGRPVALGAEAARANVAKARSAGVTAIRDTGSPGSVTLGLLETPDGAGLLACGRFLAPLGQYFPGLHVPVPAEDLVGAALAEVAAGARWVKLIADFPVLHPGQAPLDPSPTYPLADVRRLVQAVHAAGARVAAHATTRHVAELIDAGIDSVEHGTALTQADVSALAARGGAWTPTLCATIGTDLSPSDPERRRHRRELCERLSSLLPAAARRGVTIMTGTDVVGSIPHEVALLADLGLPPQAALAAASTAARQFLGFAAGIQHGEPADLVSYDNDPRDDPAVLAHPVAVFAGGIRIH
jgi:imidazolonepropionase-like amidohydrolase